MKKTHCVWFALVMMAVLGRSPAHADATSDFTRNLDSQIAILDDAVGKTEVNSSSMSETNSLNEQMLYLNAFLLRLRGTFGVEVEGFTHFFLVPEIELVWQRALPDGWALYKPANKIE